MAATVFEKLSQIYYSPGEAGAYSGAQSLLRAFRVKHPETPISLKKVTSFLALQTAHSLHRKSFKNYKCNSLFFPRVNHQFVADLIDMAAYAKYNSGYKYILCVMDGMSRYLYCRKLKTKKGSEVLEAFQEIFKEADLFPVVLTTDKGLEFISKPTLDYFKKNKIKYFTSYGRKKCSNIERLNRTLKTMFYRCFDKNLNREWIGLLDKIVKTYNSNHHRSISMTPSEAQDPINAVLLSENYYKKIKKIKFEKAFLKKGDIVRINIDRGPLSKKYEMAWSRALYRVASKPKYNVGGYRPSYVIEYLNGTPINGTFSPEELLKVDKATFLDSYNFPIYKVLKQKGSKSLVRWLGYDEKDDSWIPSKNIKGVVSDNFD